MSPNVLEYSTDNEIIKYDVKESRELHSKVRVRAPLGLKNDRLYCPQRGKYDSQPYKIQKSTG